MAHIDMQRLCLNRTHTLNCQHNVTLASQVELRSGVSFSFFILWRLLLDNESEMMAAKRTLY